MQEHIVHQKSVNPKFHRGMTQNSSTLCTMYIISQHEIMDRSSKIYVTSDYIISDTKLRIVNSDCVFYATEVVMKLST